MRASFRCPFPMELPVCSLCSIPALKTIEYYDEDKYFFSRSKEGKKMNLCTECIVGKKIPFYCKHHDNWTDARILSFDDQSCLHSIMFTCGCIEKVLLNSKNSKSHLLQSQTREKPLLNRKCKLLVIAPHNKLELKDEFKGGCENHNFYESAGLDFEKKNPLERNSDAGQFLERKYSMRHHSTPIKDPKTGGFNSKCSTIEKSSNQNFNATHQIKYISLKSHESIRPESVNRNNNAWQAKNESKKYSQTIRPSFWKDDSRHHVSYSLSSGDFTHGHCNLDVKMDTTISRKVPIESKNNCESGINKRKRNVIQWTNDEDELMIKIISDQEKPIRWNKVAKELSSERSPKQCRERFLNHLHPEVRRDPWSIAEDVLIINLYSIFGAHWAKMSSCISGRTDNHIKNRFHHLRRKMERDTLKIEKCGHFSKLGREYQSEICEKLAEKRKHQNAFQKKTSEAEGFTVAKVLNLLTMESKIAEIHTAERNSQEHDIFRTALCGEQCKRCFLFLPSKQCGTKICNITGWCKSCSNIDAYISRDSLYRCLQLLGEKKNFFSID